MSGVPLSEPTRVRLEVLFRVEDREVAKAMLVTECGSNLPFCERATAPQLERLRFAALKLSGGNLERLREAVELAKIDWRDLLMAAGFGNNVRAHERWMPAAPPD
jgi:hypothetical protein